jgi:hypothetical protein
MPIISGGVAQPAEEKRAYLAHSTDPVDGTSGTFAGEADPGAILSANGGYLYTNQGTKASPVWVKIGPSLQVDIAIDLASIAANTTTDTTVSVSPAGLVLAGDVVWFMGCAVLDNGLIVQGVHTVAANSFKLRVSNVSAGAIDAASHTFSFVVQKMTT